MLGYEVYSKASEENYRISEVLQMIYQVGRKNCAQEEGLPEDPEQSEKMKISKESEVSEQENFEDLCSEDSFFEQEESEYTIPKNIENIKTAKQREKGISKNENDMQRRTDKYRGQAEQKKQIQNKKTTGLKKSMKQKKTAGRKKAAKYKKYAGYVVIFILLAAVAAVLVKFEVLSTVQVGGMLFLAAGIFIYAAGIQKENFQKGERKKSQVSDDFDEEMGTCILQQGKNIKIAVLVSLNPEEYVNILLYREETRIGKEGRQADVCIDRDVISRVHAKILRREEEYFLMDLDSTNGTYINGKRLGGDGMEKLQQGDQMCIRDRYIIKVFLYLILAVMTLIRWLLKIPMMLGNILLYFLSIIFILTGVLSYGFALESARECGRMIIIGMAFGAIPDFVPFLGKSLETLVAKLLSMTNE